ncbi:MAG TPA: hypothetical protein VHL81_15300 [Gemmatimonadales bacterium]|nr:hypothetical protein [Gemmatimonadales bacterium]
MSEPGELDALRQALDGEYRIERVLEVRAGFARVLAQDLSLARSVEIVALRPAPSTGPRLDTFLTDARTLARINHPNVVAVHRASVRDGVAYMAREHPVGETLAVKLENGALHAGEVVSLGRDVLRGLEASHAEGVVHPDLAPGTIVCLPGRAMLAGLGATAVSGAERARDLHAAGQILYQAATGERWDGAPTDRVSSRRPVPRRLRRVLGRALAPRAEDRWPDATAFRRALDGLSPSRLRWTMVAAAAAGAGVLALAGGAWLFRDAVARRWDPGPPGGEARELAVLPLEVVGGRPADALGTEIAQLMQLTLDNVPGLELTSQRRVLRWWERQGRDAGGAQAQAAKDLSAHWVAHGLVKRRDDSLWVRITLYDAAGAKTPLPELRGSERDFAALGDTLAINVLRAAAPDLEPLYRGVQNLSDVPLIALKAFLQGEAAFERDAWAPAARNYEAAIGADSGFALAWWRLANVKRWRRMPYDFDLRGFYDRLGGHLRPEDRSLVEALLEPDVERRLARMEASVVRAPGDAYTRFLYAEELFHRGPLVGRGIEQAARVMGEAIALDSSLAEAYNHLFVLQLRAGRAAEARRLLDLRRRVSLRPAPGDPDVVSLLELAYDERFVPWLGGLKRALIEWRADSARLADVARVMRLGGPWFDIPRTQVALAGILVRRGPPDDSAQASARTGIGLGLLALGRPDAGMAQLDSAVALLPTAEARLQQAEWRAVPQAVGVPALRSASDRRWDRRLEELAADSATSVRALWALSLRRLAAGDSSAFERDRARLDALAPATPLGVLLRAAGEAARGHRHAALAISDSVRPLFAVNHPPDPFAGAVFHLLRAEWLAAGGDARAADREWRWYEGSDFDGWPAGVPQAGEIEAAFGVHARWRRGAARLDGATTAPDTLAACALLVRVAELWQQAEPGMEPLASAARIRAGGCPR